MEPLSAASAFSQIVSLLGLFKSERKGHELQGVYDFLEWLKEHGFDELKSGIEQNRQVSDGIEELLKVKTDEVLLKLDRLDDMFASLATNVEYFSKLAVSVRPKAMLSEQAVSILKQMAEKKTSAIIKTNALEEVGPVILSQDNKGKIEYTDGQFIEDDLNTLVALGLLHLQHTEKGAEKYIYTRFADQYLRELQGD